MPPRILIADDNAIFRRSLRQLLEGADHWEIVEAKSGEEAVTKSVETRPNVIILDLAMPGKDGLAAARDISASLPETPILMCTMHMSPLVEVEALKSGIRKVLYKADSSLLVPAIRQLLDPEPPSNESPTAEIILPPAAASNPALPAPLPTAPTEAADEAVPPSLPTNVA
jgi:DNA-binding NarL/FixJ family response regulator